MTDRLRWGIIGTGAIAHAFARGLQGSETGDLAAVGSRSLDSARRFADEFGGVRACDGYDAVLDDDGVDAVYIATPHPMHARWAVRAAAAGKHILCEKPLALNLPEATAIVEAARRHDVFLMEAFMYRCHPQTARLVEMIRDGRIGEVRLVQATFSFHAEVGDDHRLRSPELGGGGILDVGCYCMSMARLVAGAATGRSFADPIEVTGVAHLGTTGVDEWAAATVRFPGDLIATLSTGVRLGQENVARIYGSEGWILVPNPWIPCPAGGATEIVLHRNGVGEPEVARVEDPRGLYTIEADTVAASIGARQAPSPAMTWDDTLGNMAALDGWRSAIGLRYPMERMDADIPPVHGRPLEARAGSPMPYSAVAGIDKRVSRLVMGVDNQGELPHAAVMFDDFYERGGTTFDTAWIYGNGRCEEVLGRWIEMRGLREEVVILDKGAHTPFCTPEDAVRQLDASLDRLRTDYVDLYLLHRDNPEIPVGEFVDALNRLVDTGRVRAFGGSNWSIARLQEADEYARAHGLSGFAAVSNNFSLARMVDPVWAGCVASSSPEWRAWLERAGLPLFAWSSQARGFFTGRARPGDRSDPELARCWYSDDNFQRLARAIEIAERRHVEPLHVALAYVLRQPFPTFALIGPRSLAETRTSVPALDVDLDPDEIAWLALDRDKRPW